MSKQTEEPATAETLFWWTTTKDGRELVAASIDKEEVERAHPPYKLEAFEQIILKFHQRSRQSAIITALQMLGIKVFVIDASVAESKAELVQHISDVMDFGADDETDTDEYTSVQRCLLYKDEQNRLFNLMLPKNHSASDRNWCEQLESFSVSRALVAFVMLLRSIPCISSKEDMIQNLKPGYLCLILGLVFSTEISLSSLNTSMMVRGTPSLSTHSVKSFMGSSDGLRKLILLMLALASGATGWVQRFFTIGGIVLACLVLLANLGARAWHFLHFKPLQYKGRGSFAYAFFVAVLAGMAMPFMGHRTTRAGGKVAMDHVIMTSMIVGCFILITSLEEFQKFLVVGSVQCDQQVLHLNLGLWWMVTVICSLLKVRRIPRKDEIPQSEQDSLLFEEQASPVGFRVPNLPDFVVDLTIAPRKYFGDVIELALYILVALAVGYSYANVDAR